MRYEMAMTKNVRRFLGAVRELTQRGPGLEGMGLLGGEPGEGKTTTLAFVCNQVNGVYVRANACWTVTAMLGEICHELGLPRQRLKHPMMNAAIEALMNEPRPIFVDEADYLLRQIEMIDSLRDIYDLAPGAAVVLVGMEDLARRIREHGRLARRVTQWIEFTGIDLADTRVLALAVCEMAVTDDLLKDLHGKARGNIGREVVGLSKIEAYGKANGHGPDKPVTLAAWGDRPYFYDQPSFARRRKQ